VIGPTVIGRDARVGPGAIVAQCIVAPGARVAAASMHRHSVVVGSGNPQAEVDAEADAAPLDEISFETPHPSPPSIYPRLKVVGDACIAAVGLLVLLPFLLLVAMTVEIESRGPILYGDLRETLGGRTFRCWKFRTMFQGAAARQRELMKTNEVDGPQFKMEADPRVTRVGAWLRRLSIDELPQLINVVRGEMSLVGPRPSPFRENQICIPWREARLSVRPGITGLWQVCRAERNAADFHQWIHYDLLYVRNMSFMVDVRLIAATFVTLLLGWRVPVTWVLPAAALRPADPHGAMTEAAYDSVRA
jgi:lipopolysaccharide/colanic/teichoic acid biosynthesis glycosyltransferase